MQRRKFYLITLLLILLALICQFVGMNKISEPSRAIAKSLTIPKAEGKQLKLKAADEAKIGKASLQNQLVI